MITSLEQFIDEYESLFYQFLQLLSVNYLIDPCFIIFYRKKSLEF